MRTARPLRASAAPILGWHPLPSMLGWQTGGNREAELCFTRAARPEGKWGDSQEGRNRRCLPSSRAAASVHASNRRAAAALSESEAANQPAMRGQFRYVFQGEHKRASARSFAPLRMTIEISWWQKGVCCNSLQGPLRQRLTALPPPLEGEAGSGGEDNIGNAQGAEFSSCGAHRNRLTAARRL